MTQFLRAIVCGAALMGATFAAIPVRADAPPSDAPVACGAKGNYTFTGIGADWTAVTPSVLKQISALGLMAIKTGCDVSAICVSTGITKDDMASARKSCANMTRAFIQTVIKPEQVTKRGQVTVAAKKPGGGLAPGVIYVTVR